MKIPDMTLYKKGKSQAANVKGVRASFTPSMLMEICSHMTAEARTFADAVSRYYNGMSRDSINETSELLKGFSLAGVENYYPIVPPCGGRGLKSKLCFVGVKFIHLPHAWIECKKWKPLYNQG